MRSDHNLLKFRIVSRLPPTPTRGEVISATNFTNYHETLLSAKLGFWAILGWFTLRSLLYVVVL